MQNVNLKANPPSTRDYYGKYMPLVRSQLHALCLIKAGTNKRGVLTAMNLNGFPI